MSAAVSGSLSDEAGAGFSNATAASSTVGPPTVASDRMNVSKRILDTNYDRRSESKKRELQREMFEMDDSDGVPGLSDD